MPQPPSAKRLTAGERRLAEVIDSSTSPRPSPNEKTAAARSQVDLVWNADPDR
jgi:hypothetical protein